MNNLWFNYIIFEEKNKTYIGSTVNINRRIRQHNGIIKGGAKYTRGGKWEYFCVLIDLNHTKNTALSYEWHLKHIKCKKYKPLAEGTFGALSRNWSFAPIDIPRLKRVNALEQYLKNKTKVRYDHILFISRKYKNLKPILPVTIIIIYLDEINTDNINKYIECIKNIDIIFNNY